MINLSDCIELGVLGKPHGIKGHLILKLNSLSFDDIQEMESVFIIIDGLPVPFFIEEFSERSPETLLIKFDTIYSESDARKISDRNLFIEKKFIQKHQHVDFPNDSLVGYLVNDKHFGNIGIFDSVINLETHALMRILKGKIEILIPLQQEFIVSIDDTKKEIFVDCPSGLIDLYL
jgi:16S rRNA processing protein RimM